MKIILTRHGETIENKEEILQGWKNSHLSQKGKKQAKQIAERLKEKNIDTIYTSDLKRCFETAKEIAKYHKNAEFIKEKLLRERKLGEFEGKKIKKADWDALPGNVYTNHPKDGETFMEVWDRQQKFYKIIIKKHIDETILVVGHGGSMRFLQGIIQNKNFKESLNTTILENTAISEFEIYKERNAKTIKNNSKTHLK